MEFFQPVSKEELISLLKVKTADTYFAAGCTDLMIQLRERKINPNI
jgi:CO/xanthine dehydrogenase FAD-binding subunit